jgi:hypothetical protein
VCLDLLADTRFFSLLLAIDRDLAAHAHAGGCACGGPLYVANFARKPMVLAEDRRNSAACAASVTA